MSPLHFVKIGQLLQQLKPAFTDTYRSACSPSINRSWKRWWLLQRGPLQHECSVWHRTLLNLLRFTVPCSCEQVITGLNTQSHINKQTNWLYAKAV